MSGGDAMRQHPITRQAIGRERSLSDGGGAHPLDIRPDHNPSDLFACLWFKATTVRPLLLRMPDTIVIEQGRFQQWFFTSKRGEILRRKRDKLTKDRVFRFFQEKLTAGIAAVFVHSVKTDDERVLYTEHLSLPALESLLFKVSTVEHGLLQAFVVPKSGYNTAIESVYSHDGCSFLATRATNVHLMINHMVSLNDRVATFEGAANVTTKKPMASPTLLAELKRINDDIVDQIHLAIGLEATRMTLYFKIGLDNHLYFLYPSTILFQNEDVLPPFELALHPGVLMTVAPSPNTHRRRRKCPGCHRLDRDASESQVTFLVTYKAIIAAHAQNSDDSLELHQYTIPHIIQSTNTALSVEKYLALTKTASFLYKTTEVCETCCRSINAKAMLTPQHALPAVQPTTARRSTRLSIAHRRATSATPRLSVLRPAEATPVLPSPNVALVQPLRPSSAASTTPRTSVPPTTISGSLEKLRMQLVQTTSEHTPSLETLLIEHEMHPQHTCVHINYLSTLATSLGIVLTTDEWKAIAMYCEPHTDLALVDLHILDELLRLPRAPQPPRPQSCGHNARPQPPSHRGRLASPPTTPPALKATAPDPNSTPLLPESKIDDLTSEERAWLESVLQRQA
ncbi:hypothetical protein SPRG_07016 [Saprolegnia parasitica CBS 223.65]|uniref:Uncharacterized protein n=1 Tax=Saprolegnia parasitica (strain CBS 223.65) TaxID=695850 RepID=A0A067CA96_SAPPC|nr:hypothetical protein SPRG_07016 [Saprolegnia parasitica CBS 223.65]KDO27428.1 hypothetical protein SPRG_07016 [Saprolegnia parasitica CBS 223.65]|eukprot:XP_012201868.1 hypothetical protein SPRG_07016 [Saprolegnia parasitica CBS 223.65]